MCESVLPDHAEAVGIHADPGLQRQALQQRCPRAKPAAVSFDGGPVSSLLRTSKAANSSFGRQRRVSLRRALGLGDLHHDFPARRDRARSRLSAACRRCPRMSNIVPLDMFELCGIATNCAPVSRLVMLEPAPQVFRPRALDGAEGNERPAVAASAEVKTTRCRFAQLGIGDHSQPISAVNRPGWLYWSAVATCFFQKLPRMASEFSSCCRLWSLGLVDAPYFAEHRATSCLLQLGQSPPGCGGHQVRVIVVEPHLQPQVLRVVGHDQEVQRPLDADLLARHRMQHRQARSRSGRPVSGSAK